jgi:hypothetical protein
MSEEALTTAATPVVPVADNKKKTPGLLNKRHAQALTKAESISLAAQHEDHAPALAARDISADFVTKLLSDADAARDKAAEAVASTTARIAATADEKKAANGLIASLREVQKAAKQRYLRTNRIALKDYLVGKNLNGSRANLEQTSQTIINKAAEDTLPGITSAKVKSLRTARQAWIDANTAKAESRSSAVTDRVELNDMLKSIEDRKLAIQLAADAEWPHTGDENVGIRGKFGLTAKRPLIA